MYCFRSDELHTQSGGFWPHGHMFMAARIHAEDCHLAQPSARWRSSTPVSMMWRRDSRAGRGHSGNSSRNNTPLLAMAQAPITGCPLRQAPSNPAVPPEGWGAKNGTLVLLTKPAQARARLDFPTPGAPVINTGSLLVAAMHSHFLAWASPLRWSHPEVVPVPLASRCACGR